LPSGRLEMRTRLSRSTRAAAATRRIGFVMR
jgi:hypothetical protein